VGLFEMLENQSLGIVTILQVVVGPLVLALALAYGVYRYRHGRIGTTREDAPKALVATAVAGMIAFCIVIVIGSVVIIRSINQTAETTGSSTRPAQPGPAMDKVNREQNRETREPNNRNVPPAIHIIAILAVAMHRSEGVSPHGL
jgi:predicted PurR-regulated permease PerM